MFAVFLVISLLSVAYGVVVMLNVRGGADHIARSAPKIAQVVPEVRQRQPQGPARWTLGRARLRRRPSIGRPHQVSLTHSKCPVADRPSDIPERCRAPVSVPRVRFSGNVYGLPRGECPCLGIRLREDA